MRGSVLIGNAAIPPRLGPRFSQDSHFGVRERGLNSPKAVDTTSKLLEILCNYSVRAVQVNPVYEFDRLIFVLEIACVFYINSSTS